MKAPENIYIQPDAQDGWFMVNNPNNTLVKYTRTDAFIEKARKWFEQQPETYDANGVRVYGLSDFEDFKKYIGE